MQSPNAKLTKAGIAHPVKDTRTTISYPTLCKHNAACLPFRWNMSKLTKSDSPTKNVHLSRHKTSRGAYLYDTDMWR